MADNVVQPLQFVGDNQALVKALQLGHAGATAVFYDQYAQHVQRVLARILGVDPELAELLHDVFLQALSNIAKLKDPQKLKPWLTSIAVYTARGCIRKRQRKRWLSFRPLEELPELQAPDSSSEDREALRCTYKLLARLPANHRIAFTLRFIDGMELAEIADACRVSLATVKRWIHCAQETFTAAAKEHPALAPWVEDGETRRTK